MSHSFYGKQWIDAQVALGDILQFEVPPDQAKPERDKIAAFQLLATMYIKYVQVFRRLEQCYDQIVHPQKRRVLRHLLDGVMGRVLEVKNEMVNLEFSEFHYFDDILSDLKLTPSDIEMPIPKYFTHERAKALKEREKLLGQILARLGSNSRDGDKEDIKLSTEEAIRLIQVHERARQGRLRAKFMREIRQQEEREKMAATRGAPTLDPEVAAIRIQKLWKGCAQRKKTKKERDEEMIFIGMYPAPAPPPKSTHYALAVKNEGERRRVQEVNEQEYQQALINVKDKIRETEGPDVKETLMDQIRQWFIECRDALGRFPDYPTEEEGGSLAIFKEKDPAEVEAELKAKDEEGGKKKKGKKEGKGKKKDKKDKKKKKKKGKKGKNDEEEEGWKMSESKFVPAIKEGCETYSSIWYVRNEAENFSQKHDVELIKEEKRLEVESEIRVQVDELMRQELKNLKLAIDRDKGKKTKKGKSGKKKKKKSGKKKGKKGKKQKDLTPDRTIESLYEELVSEGIIVRPPRIQMREYTGEYSYLGTTLRQANIEPMPSLSDVRRLVTEYAILPLGSPAVHEKAPLVKSVLLTGPHGTGKKMLVHSICTETGANLFDLTATNLMGKYPGRDGLKLLLHIIFKVGKALQPSVIFVDNCERMFRKKVPKSDSSDPKRLKKELPKMLKMIKPDDRLLLIGSSNSPFEAELKPMMSTYQRIILIPRPDYASRHLIWRTLIIKHGGVITNLFDVSSLSKVSDGYTPGMMDSACKAILSERRVNQIHKKPLQALEFIAPLARLDPVYKEEEEQYKTWYAKTPLGKKRAKAAAGDDEDAGKGKKGGKKGQGKKGKGKKKK